MASCLHQEYCMSRSLIAALLMTLVSITAGSVTALAQSVDRPTVVVRTDLGDITIELRPDAAPRTVENFLRYVDSGFYDGTLFHRVVKEFVIQGGGLLPDMSEKEPRFPPIPNEAANGLKNVRGAVAMARHPAPHSATAEFFINTEDNPPLDHSGESSSRAWGYAVFGRVVDGMPVVDDIRHRAVEDQPPYHHVPVEPVVIRSIQRISGANR